MCRHDVTWPIKMIFKEGEEKEIMEVSEEGLTERDWCLTLTISNFGTENHGDFFPFFIFLSSISFFFVQRKRHPLLCSEKDFSSLLSLDTFTSLCFSHSFRFYMNGLGEHFLIVCSSHFIAYGPSFFSTLPKKILTNVWF